jgi:hypothetical protein
MMETSSSNEYHPITIITNSLPSQSQKSSSIKLAISKDERLEYLNIPKGLIELLKINDFTIEKILEYGPSKIAEILVIDNYVAQIIFNETNNKKY